MNMTTIDGNCYRKMLLGGAAMLSDHVRELNDLNVFPVADGDTGTNMLSTLEGGLATLQQETSDDIGDCSGRFSKGILLSARGNSGVILSQIFAGIHEVIREQAQVDATMLAQAYCRGVEKSYAAVQNPTEGTILTVFRESTRYASEQICPESTPEEFLRLHIQQAQRSLRETKNLLPALAEADVVDSGAAGYLYIAEGMYEALTGKEITYTPAEQKTQPGANIDLFTRDSVMEYGYCTEALLRLTSAKGDPDAFQVSQAVKRLEEMGGDSIVAYKQEDILKVHVHTFTPGQVLAALHSFGEFLSVKVENMNLGHTGEKPQPAKAFAVVAVARGEGMTALFEQMGADRIVAGGQSANPSIEDFLDAFRDCNAKEILVLPNNKNVILAAEQAAQLYTQARIRVIPTKNFAQGYSALSVITPGIRDTDALVSSAQRAAEGVIDGEITCAVRDAVMEGRTIRAGDYMALSGGKALAVEETPEKALLALLETADIELCEIITLFTGEGVSPQRIAQLTQELEERYEDYEIVVYEGGQDVYDYLVAVE